ncbi:MAG: glycoside hydrolase family 6 protein, partial [Micromonosporaceae bacterium]|nr:glycoside hydrolase family 6 protein [Micromonosporaceae bacterium]
MRLGLSRPNRRRYVVATVSAIAVTAAGIAAVAATTPAFAATGCNVTYTANNWTEGSGAGGFTTSISITNLGDPLTAWTLTFTLPSGQSLIQGWSANWTSSGTEVTGTSLPYNGSLATGASTSAGFNGHWSGTFSSPTAFTLNGVACNSGTTPTTPPTGSQPAGSPSNPPSGSPPSSQTHVDNPYAGAKGYVNPEWKAHATAEPGGSRIANTSTAVWLDRIATIEGSGTSMGVRAHLDAALSQASGGTPVVVQFVVYDLPNRDCAALASNGELTVADHGLDRYKTEFIDPIAAIMADPKYSSLRIVNVVEDDSLPNLVTNLSIPACAEANSSGVYVQGVQYALNKLHAIPNVYNYLDLGHHAWLGWSSNFNPAVTLLTDTVRGTTAGLSSVDGFIDNTANYGALVEPNFTVSASVNGTSIRQSKWVDWNDYVDELSFTQAF